MIKINNIQVMNWEAAIRGMRNPMESYDRIDTKFGASAVYFDESKDIIMVPETVLGPNDLKLMKSLVNAGTDHSKFMRMITVSFDIVAPLYFWKEFDTYKIAVVRNSCSTMHKIEARPLRIEDFATDGMLENDIEMCLKPTMHYINELIVLYKVFNGEDKLKIHRRIVKLLPDSYLQRATITTNYQVLRNIRNSDRKTHKLTCWHEFCDFIDTLPYAKELLIEDDAYRYEKAKAFIERFDKEHGPLYKFLERADIIKPVDEEYNEALKGIKAYAEKKDSCAGLTCYNVDKENDVRYRCDNLSHTYNVAECFHYYECAKKGTGVAIPDKDIDNGLLIEPGAFNGEEF